jgi:AraC-like DNA-binding protein/mannose-6-phosphate isomerase-like protein (cupin superfamily)
MLPVNLPNIEIKVLQFLDFVHTDTQTWYNDFNKYMVDYDPKTKLHLHNWTELSIVQEGEIEYYTEDKKIPLRQGEIFLMPRGISHGWNAVVNPLILTTFHLKITAINSQGESTLNKIHQAIERRGFCFPGDDALDEILQEIHRKTDQLNEISMYSIQSLLALYLHHLFESFLNKPFKHVVNDLGDKSVRNELIVQQIRNIIDENTHLNLSMDEIGSHFSYSFRQLNRIFTSIQGSSIGKFMIEKKMDVAKKRLISSGQRIKNIALELGYQDTAYFCRLFKKNTGNSPENFRSQHLQEHHADDSASL